MPTSLFTLLLTTITTTLLCTSTLLTARCLPTGVPCTVVGRLVCDEGDSLVNTAKMEAAALLAFELAQQKIVGSLERDSLLQADTSRRFTAHEAAQKIGCAQVLFASTRRFEHLVRTEVQILSADGSAKPSTGVGYAAITYQTDSGLIADPAILTSMQRALNVALTPAPRFDTLPDGLSAKKASLITISGITFTDSVTQKPQSLLFKEHTIASYDAAITIVELLQSVDTLVVVDIDTRDAMFATAGFHLVDNDRAPSDIEMRVLRGFDIGRMITGNLVRKQNGMQLTLSNASLLIDGSYRIDASATVPVANDTKLALRDAVENAVHRLFGVTK